MATCPGKVRKQYKRDIFWIRDYVAYAAKTVMFALRRNVWDRPHLGLLDRCGRAEQRCLSLYSQQVSSAFVPHLSA